MITKEQALKAHDAIEAIRQKTDYNLQKRYRYSIGHNPSDCNEIMVIPFSSIVCAFGFVSREDAKEFLKDSENQQLLMDVFLMKELKISDK